MKEKNIGVALILSIITCGIYSFFWFVSITDDVEYASDDNDISGGIALLLTLITCGIYGIYWSYKMGKQIAIAQEKRGMIAKDNSILYLILNIIGLSIVNYCLIQSDLNDIANYEN